jgi:hypothetical protein
MFDKREEKEQNLIKNFIVVLPSPPSCKTIEGRQFVGVMKSIRVGWDEIK